MSSFGISKEFGLIFPQPMNEGISSVRHKMGRVLVASVDVVLDYLEQQREQATVSQMNDRELKDIGLTRAAIARGDERGRAAW